MLFTFSVINRLNKPSQREFFSLKNAHKTPCLGRYAVFREPINYRESKLKILLTLLIIVLVSGCATQSANVPDSWKYTGNDAVTVVAAVGVSTSGDYKSILPYHSFLIESESNPESLRLKADYDPGFRNSVTDYETKDGKFGLVKLLLKPGKYKITDITSFSPSPYAGVSLRAREKLSIPIILEPSKNYYLGSFKAHNVTAKGGFGTTNVIGAFWVANMESPPERTAIEKKYPELSGVTLENYKGTIYSPPYFFTTEKEAEQLFK
jgi:hypothetical protein